jgi:hypothetical protein
MIILSWLWLWYYHNIIPIYPQSDHDWLWYYPQSDYDILWLCGYSDIMPNLLISVDYDIHDILCWTVDYDCNDYIINIIISTTFMLITVGCNESISAMRWDVVCSHVMIVSLIIIVINYDQLFILFSSIRIMCAMWTVGFYTIVYTCIYTYWGKVMDLSIAIWVCAKIGNLRIHRCIIIVPATGK